jgi:DNA-3-methyladenine glycosylase I
MKLEEAITILKSLANGEDPNTGESFPAGSPYQQPQTVKALHKILNYCHQQNSIKKQLHRQHSNINSSMNGIFDYSKVFKLTEKTLIQYGSKQKNKSDIIKELSIFKNFATKEYSDDDYYEKIVFVIFYSGFRAATVTAKRHIIRKHFPSIKQVAAYTQSDIDKILADEKMIRHKGKIKACVKNALVIKGLIDRYGSMEKYINSFEPKNSFENILNLKKDLTNKLSFIGPTTIFHFLTDIGLQVIKPDRVLCRIFYRLGLITSENDLLGCVKQGILFSKRTGIPIRYIDIIFVAYGQEQAVEFGMDRGICLKKPRCKYCGIKDYCNFKVIAAAEKTTDSK